MVEASQKSSVPSPAQVWSRYKDIHVLAMQPFHAVINLVGASKQTRDEVQSVIDSGLKSHIWKQGANAPTNYARPIYRVLSNDLPCPCPRPVKRKGGASSEIGYLKQSFFRSFNEHKPAVTIFLFDWRDWQTMHPPNEKFDWPSHENLVLRTIKEHSDQWLKDLSVPPKYMIMILFPLPGDGINIDECRSSFKRAVQLSGDENIRSSNYFLGEGLEKLKTGMAKKFAKDVNGLAVSYYREKKNKIKKKTARLIVGQI